MRVLACLAFAVTLLLSNSVAQTRNTINQFPLADALAKGESNPKFNSSVRLFFGKQPHPAIAEKMGTYTTSKKTNAFNKSDHEACDWAFLSAIITLQSRALAEGGNAVINIQSYYYKNEFSSETEFECGAGALMAGVTLRGTVVKLVD